METWLTQEAYDRLQAELDDRQGPLRVEITKRIQLAREEGDLKENGGYHAAKEEQGKSEARIRVLRHLIENAKIGSPPAKAGEVAQGQVVTVRFTDGGEERFLLGSREEAAHASIDVYSPTSPLGGAVIGRKVGSEVTYKLPRGERSITVTIVATEAYSG